jgi:chromosome segregation ATPase
MVLRWGPLAAAAALLLAAGAVFYHPRHAAAPRAGESDVAGLRQQLDRSREGLAAAEAKLASQARRHEGTLDELRAALARLEENDKARQQAEAALESLQGRCTRLEEENTALDLALADMQKEFNAANRDLKELKQGSKDILAKAEQLEPTRKRLKTVLELYKSETQRLQEMHSEARASLREARQQIQLLKARQAALLADVQGAYLAPARPAEMTLRTRQQAARRSMMVRRCAELREVAGSEDTRRLLDTLEVVLIRLDLLNPDDPDVVRSFAALVRESNLLEEIDDALASGRDVPQVRILLVEARLILMGAQHVG